MSKTERLGPAERITIESLKNEYPIAISAAKEAVDRSGYARTKDGKFVLTFLVATSEVLTVALDNVGRSDFMEVTGGEKGTEHRKIDVIGADIVERLLSGFTKDPSFSGTLVHIEERGIWETYPKGSDRPGGEPPRIILIDPCDETNSDKFHATAMTVFDNEGKLLSAGIAQPKGGIIIFIEGNETYLLSTATKGGKLELVGTSLKNFSKVKEAPNTLRIATLTKRLKDDRRMSDLVDKIGGGEIALPSFGGYALIKMLGEEVDVMVDPFKGQPWYEVLHWGPIAQKLGFSVEYAGGEIKGASEIISVALSRHGYRVPVVISRKSLNDEIHQRVLANLPGPEQGRRESNPQ